MERDYWSKQTVDQALFPELVWSRPENRRARGKLLIIGGNLHGFAAPAGAYATAEKAGAGSLRVVLPDAIQKLVGGFFENAIFAVSTPSGSFGQQALGELLEQAAWSDGVLLAGDLGRNSETAILLEKFVTKYTGQLTITKDAVDYFKDATSLIAKRPDTALVLSLAQLQKLGSHLGVNQPFTFSMDLLQLVDALHTLTTEFDVSIVVKHLEQIVVAHAGKISTTHLKTDKEVWCVETAAHTSVWQLQNPTKTFEALTTAVLESL